jgi:hypothetical protein
MKAISLMTLFLIFLFGFGCNESITKQNAKCKLQALLNVHISDSFKITDYEEDAAIGNDLTEGFIVHFSHEEFNSIFKKVNPQKFKNINSDLYGYTIEQNNKRITAIFDPKEFTIKYTYNAE